MKSENRIPKTESDPKRKIRNGDGSFGHSGFGFLISFGFRWLLVVGCFLSSFCHADQFGEISVSADAMYSGNTFHGYAETRVTLENLSGSHAHFVTLVYPNRAYGNYGNSISRLTRSVTLAPGARELVTLLQPPLPANGDGSIEVEVDGRHAGAIRAPNSNNHCNFYSRSSRMATVFISRSLDFDAVRHALNAGRVGFTAAMAVGPPDGGGRGIHPNVWMPDTRRYGETNWLELDYAAPQTVTQIIVHSTQPPVSSGFVELLDGSGKDIVKLPASSGINRSYPSGWETEYSCPATPSVRHVRVDFGKAPPPNIAIDAVEISGPSAHQWASDARASSDNSASAVRFGGSGGANSVEGLRAENPASAWSGDWLAYTPFDAIALRPGDLSSASPETASALSSYVRAGGNLFVFGNNGVADTWRTGRKRSLHDGNEFDVGFGHCFILDSDNPSNLDPETVRALRTAVGSTARYWESLPSDSVTANTVLPVVPDLKIPTRSIVFIMLIFIIVIGPVNIIVLNRRQRRTWMLWTIPAISFATTLLVFAYSLLREGITPTVRIAGVTLLNQASHRAETVGAEGFYCPLTPGGGLHFDSDTEATPLVRIGFGSGDSREVDWSRSQHLKRGWVLARVPAIFHLRKCETCRERLQVERDNGHLLIVNGLGAPIRSLWLADADMNLYQAQDVAAGQQAPLVPLKPLRATKQAGAGALLRDVGFTARTDAFGDTGKHLRPENYLRPDTYIAVLDRNPFLEDGLGSAASRKRTRATAVVFGILGNPEKRP